jgi:hypothetical protein
MRVINTVMICNQVKRFKDLEVRPQAVRVNVEVPTEDVLESLI